MTKSLNPSNSFLWRMIFAQHYNSLQSENCLLFQFKFCAFFLITIATGGIQLFNQFYVLILQGHYHEEVKTADSSKQKFYQGNFDYIEW